MRHVQQSRAFATFVAFAWRDREEYRIAAAEVARIDQANRSARLAALDQLRAAE
jgi:cytochrome o ubiquinol oxidase subunit 1